MVTHFSDETSHNIGEPVRRISGLSISVKDDDSLNRVTTKNNRVVHIDPGLMSPEELLYQNCVNQNGGRRLTLEKLVLENELELMNGPSKFEQLKNYGKWFLDDARIKISVRILDTCFIF